MCHYFGRTNSISHQLFIWLCAQQLRIFIFMWSETLMESRLFSLASEFQLQEAICIAWTERPTATNMGKHPQFTPRAEKRIKRAQPKPAAAIQKCIIMNAEKKSRNNEFHALYSKVHTHKKRSIEMLWACVQRVHMRKRIQQTNQTKW